QPLADAQRNKYERLLDQLGIRRGDHILEIGCGWGGMAIQAARRGARVTAVTLSTEQLSWARQQASEAGLSDRIEFRLQDYRDLTGQFDHIISIEMVEAVGEAYWPLYFDTLRERLRPGGRAALQVITIDEDYFEDYRRHPDFIQERVFPGGMLPTRRHLAAHASAAGLVEHDAQRFGADYARTLQRWHTAFCRATETVRGLGFDERFLRLWRYYLAYCEAGFSTGRTDLWQLCLERPAGAR
ncbi:MAG: cyclopropane-fatty-acyl-phospholipid synthase family protein, partial [Ectothiorhodospiraceae bacterium]